MRYLDDVTHQLGLSAAHFVPKSVRHFCVFAYDLLGYLAEMTCPCLRRPV
jgi:hypothetical protein